MKFGQYELLERIAIGGMAEVYRGRVAGAEGFEKLVAIKRILPEFARDERFISMLLTEARIHSALSHRNIVQIHDLGISEDGEYFIVLEYVEGHDLRAVMEAATSLGVQIPDSLALHIADELAQALHFAHELKDSDGHPLGIIHRDVSPSNVLLSNSGEVKLSDFGIAKRQHDHSVVGTLKGNLVYMSPEQAGRGSLDRRTDVFSLGAVLFEMLTGQKPREITDEVNGWREVASGSVRSARTIRPDIPDTYESLLARALAPNPENRFVDAAAFGTAIRELRRESDAPVGPSDVKELLELLDPPRHARSPVERSRVIRLGPEAKAVAGGARPLLSPELPAPERASPAVVLAGASLPRRPENGAALRADSVNAALAAATPPPLLAGPSAAAPATPPTVTPPPPVVLPKVPVAAADLFNVVGSLPTATVSNGNGAHANGSQQFTPPPPPFGLTPGLTPPPPAATPPPQAFADVPIDVEGLATPPPLAVAGGDSGLLASGPNWGGVPRTTAGALLPAATTLRGSGPVDAGFGSGPVARTAVIRRDPPKRRGRAIAIAVVVVAAVAAIVHVKVMPLPLLAVWGKPASLSISSTPSGADVILDGRPVPDRTPARVLVHRDRADHVIEVSRAGSLPARETIRFDQSVELTTSLKLADAPLPPPPPAPVVENEAAKAAAADAPKKAAAADDVGAGKKAAKGRKAKKEKKAAKGKRAKKGKRGKHGKKSE